MYYESRGWSYTCFVLFLVLILQVVLEFAWPARVRFGGVGTVPLPFIK